MLNLHSLTLYSVCTNLLINKIILYIYTIYISICVYIQNCIVYSNIIINNVNFITVVGEKERNAGTVNIRTRDNKVHGEMAVDELIAKLKVLKETRDRSGELK